MGTGAEGTGAEGNVGQSKNSILVSTNLQKKHTSFYMKARLLKKNIDKLINNSIHFSPKFLTVI